MAKFKYEVTDNNGQQKKGVIEAKTEERAIEKLQKGGSTVISVKSAVDLENASWNFQFGTGVKLKDITIFCRQFYSVLEAGVTVIEGLRMINEQTENKALKKALLNVQVNVEKGETLAVAMGMEGKVFPELLINMVAAGETTGNLELAFLRICTQFEKDLKLKSMLRQATIYPIMVLIVAIGGITIQMVNVISNFQSLFDSLHSKLPTPTLIVIGLSNFMVKNGIFLLIAAVILVFGIITFKNSETGKTFNSKMALKIPIFRSLSIKSATAKFSLTMSTLIMSGVPIVEALGVVSNVVENRVIRKVLIDAREDVLQGVPMSVPLASAGLFPPMVYQMIKIGEETGTTEKMLDRISEIYEQEVENATKAMTTIMEPCIIVLLAVVVGGVVMAIVMPMMSMYQATGV